MAHNIIYIDDSESMQKAVSTIFLNNSDFNINSIYGISSLSEITKDFHPDIIILSYNSIDTEIKTNVSAIKKASGLSDVPLVLLVPSDLTDNEREHFMQEGVSGFIYRPFEKDAFLSKIKRVLGVAVNGPAEKESEKIYDISSFEVMQVDNHLHNLSNTAYAEETAVKNTTEEADKNSYTFDDSNDSVNTDNTVNIDSTELSQAFENLFKDDAIFKEFQELNRDAAADFAHGKPETEALEGFNIDGKIQEKNIEAGPPAGMANEYGGYEKEDNKGGFEIPPSVYENVNIAPENNDAILQYNKEKDPADDFFKDSIAALEKDADNRTSGNDNEEIAAVWGEPQDKTEPDKPINDSYKVFDSADNIDKKEEEIEIYKDNANLPSGYEIKKQEEENIESDILIRDAIPTKGDTKLEILNEQSVLKFDEFLKSSVQKIIGEIKPEIIENIKVMLPEIIERLVKEEIEKIKQLAIKD